MDDGSNDIIVIRSVFWIKGTWSLITSVPLYECFFSFAVSYTFLSLMYVLVCLYSLAYPYMF